MREGISGPIPSFLSLSPSHCLTLFISHFFLYLYHFLSFFSSLFFPSHLSVSLILLLLLLVSLSLPLSLWQAVVWLQLIAVEINKASKFVFLL